jgi:hypothetical protein
MKYRTLAATVVLSLGLGACAGVQAMREGERLEKEGNLPPTNARGEIVALMRTYLNDPTNVRGAFVTEPAIRELGNNNRYAVCLRYNARDSSGRYAGSKDSIVTFWQGRLDRIVDNARERCKDAAYQPFPELERMTR